MSLLNKYLAKVSNENIEDSTLVEDAVDMDQKLGENVGTLAEQIRRRAEAARNKEDTESTEETPEETPEETSTQEPVVEKTENKSEDLDDSLGEPLDEKTEEETGEKIKEDPIEEELSEDTKEVEEATKDIKNQTEKVEDKSENDMDSTEDDAEIDDENDEDDKELSDEDKEEVKAELESYKTLVLKAYNEGGLSVENAAVLEPSLKHIFAKAGIKDNVVVPSIEHFQHSSSHAMIATGNILDHIDAALDALNQ